MVADGLSCPTLNTPRPPSSSICTKIGHLCKFCAHPPHTGWTPTKLYHPKIWRGHSQYKSVPAKRVFGGSHSPNFPGGRDWRNALSPVNMRLLFCGVESEGGQLLDIRGSSQRGAMHNLARWKCTFRSVCHLINSFCLARARALSLSYNGVQS